MHREMPLICARSHHHSEALCFLTTKPVLKPDSAVTVVVHGVILALSGQSSEWGWHCAGATQGAVPYSRAVQAVLCRLGRGLSWPFCHQSQAGTSFAGLVTAGELFLGVTTHCHVLVHLVN